ncbi:MAG: hypothetical protein H6R10_2132 [Rhodocyclaceae bacterium]|nr:hypothetical protein [Rhodocyclaceae bacterium]
MACLSTRTAAALAAILLLGACASYNGRGLQPGQSVLADVEQVMGAPAMRWREADGSELLAYPRGPAGYHTYMARIGPDGRLLSLENVLDTRHFALVREGMSQDQVLRVLGPPYPGWTVYFKARDELAWEWRYCDDWNEPARFNVFFDGTSGKVRSTGSLTESQRFGPISILSGFGGSDGGWRQWCSH